MYIENSNLQIMACLIQQLSISNHVISHYISDLVYANV